MEERFIPYDGLVPDTPHKGELLVLTNHRVITFIHSNGHNDAFFAPLEEMKGVSVKANTRETKNLSQGFIMIIVGILAYFIIGYALDSVTIASVLGGIILFMGVLFIARYFFWEEEEKGVITFQGGSWELSFPYKSNMAGACVYSLVNRFFQLKLGINSHTAYEASAGGGSWDVQPCDAPSHTSSLEDDAPGSHLSEYGSLDSRPYEQQPGQPVPENGSLDSRPYKQQPGQPVPEEGPLDSRPYEQEPGPPVPEEGPLDSRPYEQEPGPPVPEDSSLDSRPYEQEPGPPVPEEGSLDSTPYEQEPGSPVPEEGSLDSRPYEQEPGSPVPEEGPDSSRSF